MHLLSLEVRHWRGLEHEHLADLAEGLNLICGPNEAGKSRLFQALRFALWESHKGRAAYKEALAGWASAESPWVAVELDKDGVRYRVEKQFLKGSYAKLEGGGETLKDKAAEEKLRRLLEVGAGGGRGELDPQDRGLWRLLWITQGESRRAPSDDLNEGPKAALQDLLSDEVGEVTAGPAGLRLLERARREAERYWTATGKPKSGGELGKAQAEAEVLRAARDEAAQAREALAQEVRELAVSREELADLAPRRDAQQERCKAAQARALAAREASSALDTHTARRESLEVLLREAEARLQERYKLREEEASRRREEARLASRLEELEAHLTVKEKELAAAAREAEEAEKARGEAEAATRRARAHRERQRILAEKKALETRLQEAEGLQRTLEELRRTLATLPIDGAGLKHLQGLEREWTQARARLEGASVGVTLEALAPWVLRRDSEPAGGDGESHREMEAGDLFEARISEPTTLTLGDVARVKILPGGEGLSGLRDRARDARGALGTALEEAGAESVDHAREQQERRARAEREAATQEALLERSAPGGVEELKGELEAVGLRLAALPEEEGREEGRETEEVASAEEALEAAERELRQARGAREALASAVQESRTEAAVAKQELASLRRQGEGPARRLAEDPPEEELEKARDERERRLGEASLEAKALRQRFEEAGGEEAGADLEQAQRALDRLKEKGEDLEGRIRTLEGRISARKGAGLYETLQEKERELAEAEVRRQRVELRAAAAKKLLETLERQKQEAQQRLTEPVRRRIEPYLKTLFPGSDLSIDEDWQVRGLATANLEEGFGELSAGAQEQLSLLVRLGLAEVFAEGRRLPLILDDALVHTDRRRRQVMLQLLGRAARHLQILVFTCHDEGYDGLGPHRTYRLAGAARI